MVQIPSPQYLNRLLLQTVFSFLNLTRTFPSENRHGNVVGTVQIPLHLRLQVREGIEAQIIVKPFRVVSVTSLNLPLKAVLFM